MGPHIWQYIPGHVELSYTQYTNIVLECMIEHLRKYIFKILHTCWPRPNFLKIVKMANIRQFRVFLQH